jgi:putative ABC transport system ATP-binding protein
MDRPDEGRIEVDGREVTSLPRGGQAAYRRTIGFVFQRFHLLPALSVLDNVVAPVLPYRTSFDKFGRARELLQAIGLGDRATSFPARLSGGEQQRVAIARALINDPGLVLADEPTGNLDSSTGTEIMDLLVGLRHDRGLTVMVATHDPLVAARGDRIVRLRDGSVVEDVPVTPRAPEVVMGDIGRLGPAR